MKKTLTTITLAITAIAMTAGMANAAVLVAKPPGKKPGVALQHTDCADTVGFLPRIHAGEVRQMGEYGKVYLVEMCPGEDNFSALFSNGNASGLRSVIARNEVLSAHLYDKDYEPRDVFGIARGANETVYLYVHKSGY